MSQSALSALAAQPDVPSASELSSLADTLHDRKSSVNRQRANAEADKRNVLGGHVHPSDLGKISLIQLFNQTPGTARGHDNASSSRDAHSMSPLSKVRSLPPTSKSKARTGTFAGSPPPPSGASGSGTPIGGSGPGRPKIKVKRESDREREPSIASLPGSHAVGESDAASPSFEADWDEEGGPSRPGRAYKRKRQGTASALDNDSDMSLSEAESPEPSSLRFDSHRPGLPNFSASASSSSTKLRLNPTAQTASIRRESVGNNLLRKASIRGDIPLTPYQAQLAAQWELPRRTLETVIPTKGQPRPHREYPIKPDDVDVDFAAMDWRERDKERDRVDTGGNGPGAGQAVVKESSNRARDRKQDQVPLHIFQQWADGWFRTLTEEDLAWLSSKSADMEPFQTPALGRHYSEVWAEEEAQELPMQTVYLPGANATVTPFSGSRALQSSANGRNATETHQASHFDPRKLRDDNLTSSAADDARAGPITERLLSAVLPQPPMPSHMDASPQPTGGGGLVLVNGQGSGIGPSQDLSIFEQRLANELKAIDVIGRDQSFDWSERTDDEVSVALRTVQKLLREQIQENEQRKSILFQIAMERMAYQEYLSCLASVEREIESGWLRRQTQIKKSMQAQKKKKGGGSNSSSNNNNSSSSASGSGNAAAAAAAMGSQAGSAALGSPAPGTPGATGMVAQGSSQGNGTPGGPGFSGPTHAPGGGPIRPQFSEALIGAMQRRLQLKFALEPLFANKPLAKLTPTESIYAGMHNDEAAPPSEQRNDEALTPQVANGVPLPIDVQAPRANGTPSHFAA